MAAAATTVTATESTKPTVSPPIITKVDSVMSNMEDDAAAAAGVRVLGLHEYKEAALSLAEAFKDDDVSRYFIYTPDRDGWTEQQKWDLHVKVMEYITYAHLLRGLVVSAGPNYDCVALWYVLYSNQVLHSFVQESECALELTRTSGCLQGRTWTTGLRSSVPDSGA